MFSDCNSVHLQKYNKLNQQATQKRHETPTYKHKIISYDKIFRIEVSNISFGLLFENFNCKFSNPPELMINTSYLSIYIIDKFKDDRWIYMIFIL